MNLWDKYFKDISDLYCYCLLKNHFHLLVKFKDIKDLSGLTNLIGLNNLNISRIFSNFFNAYSKSINKAYNRTGSLFERPFKRKIIDNMKYLCNIINYIHYNPVKHNFTENIAEYPYSSYSNIYNDLTGFVSMDNIKKIFGDLELFREYHKRYIGDENLNDYIIE